MVNYDSLPSWVSDDMRRTEQARQKELEKQAKRDAEFQRLVALVEQLVHLVTKLVPHQAPKTTKRRLGAEPDRVGRALRDLPIGRSMIIEGKSPAQAKAQVSYWRNSRGTDLRISATPDGKLKVTRWR